MPQVRIEGSNQQCRLASMGGILVGLVAALAAVVPVLLTPPASSSRHADASADVGPAASPGAAVAARMAEPESHAAGVPPPALAVDIGRIADEPPPVVERRRVQQYSRTPITGLEPRPPGDTDQHEWNRSEQDRQRGVEQFGGTPLTESAVEAGLSWLAAHQSPDGSWDRFHFDRQCPDDDRCLGVAIRRTENDLRPGLTGLALLAFLGAGYTDRSGPHQAVVRAGVDALLNMQTPGGGFSAREGMAGYNDSLATLALAEFHGLTRDDRLRAPLERAVARLVASQQSLGGWDYGRWSGSGRNDTSITAWAVQALHACASVGIDVPRETLVRAALHFGRAVERDGHVRYSDSGSGFRLDSSLRPVYRRGPAMVAAGLTCEQLLGWRLDSRTALLQRGLILADLPSAAKARGRDPKQQHNEYYWYYGTLAMFQRGADDWSRWNARLRDTLLPLQERKKTADGRRRHSYGSWPPYGNNWGMFGRMAGRVYTTALCTLTLEIYYRHTPAYLNGQVHFSADDWCGYLRRAAERERLSAIDCLAQLRVEVAEPALVDLLNDDNRTAALAAAQALGMMDSPLGVPLIEEVITRLPPWQRPSLQMALERGRAVAALPRVDGHVRLYDPASRRATLELPRSYVGMSVGVYRAGELIARMRVIQRFSARTVVVTECIDNNVKGNPQPGDRVVQE